jgi:uncharacterized protein (DUF2252 family)
MTTSLDVVQHIQAFNAGREPERLQLKYRKMRQSTFTFMRGSCHLFVERLPLASVLRNAPLVWACGDLHLENFGSYKADDRLVHFDINDFDEAALAPASWDLVRMLSSIDVALTELGLKRKQVRAMAALFLGAYVAALTRGKALWVERDNAQGLVGELLNSLRTRTRPAFLDSCAPRAAGRRATRRLRVDGTRALPASAAQTATVSHFMADFAKSQPNQNFFQVLDVARRIAGTGSLGLDRFVVLVEGKGSPDGNYLLDLKEAAPSCLLAPLKCHLKVKQPPWATQGQRIVGVADRVQAVPMAFTHAVLMDERSFILRGLQPSEDRIGLLQRQATTPEQMLALMSHLGQLVAWGHLRASGRGGAANADDLLAFATRSKWPARLLDSAHLSAEQTRSDAALFNQAFDEGQLLI